MITREQLVESARGAGGGVIRNHRTLRTMPFTEADLGFAVALAVVLTGISLAVAPWMFDGWRWAFTRAGAALSLGTSVRDVSVSVLNVPAPLLEVHARLPGPTALSVATGVVILLFVAAGFLRERALPLTYILRALAVVLASSVGVFLSGAHPNNLDLPLYCRALIKISVGIWLFVPAGFSLTLLLVDISWTAKAVVTAAALCHLAVFIPVQQLLTMYVVYHLSVVVIPVVFVVGSVMPQVIILISLYSCAASLPPRRV